MRLCTILPAPEGAELAINLRSVSLAKSTEQYTCLSYVWGDQSAPVAISINGQQHYVRRSLHSLLCRLRAFDIGTNIWIDALCIDQTDDAEKAEQVKLMANIYSTAQEVVIGLEERAQYVTGLASSYAVVEAAIEGLANDSHLFSLDCRVFAGSTEADKTAHGLLQRLLSSTWFSRTWTIQELSLIHI